MNEICERLDGLPLAIELAAARVDVLPPRALLERIDHRLALLTGGPKDAPVRQQSMRETIAWSHDLLTPGEQVLLRRLAVFIGGFSLDGANAVMDEGTDVLNDVSTLVANSLVKRVQGPNDEPRFQLLETIRDFALERLVEAGEADQTRSVHAELCLNLAESAIPHYDGPELPIYKDRVNAELDNSRAAMAWSLEMGAFETAIRLAGALWRVWWPAHAIGGRPWTERVVEGKMWIDRILPDCEGLPVRSIAEALIGAGALSNMLGRPQDAREHTEELLKRSEHDQYSYGIFWACFQRGNAELDDGNLELAKSWLERALHVAPTVRNPVNHQALALGCLADVAKASGFDDDATRLADEGVVKSRLCGNPHCLSWIALIAGRLHLKHGDAGGAASLLGESLEAYVRLSDLGGIRAATAELARVALAAGQPDQAVRFLLAVRELPHHAHDREVFDAAVMETRSRLGEDVYRQMGERQSNLSWDDLTAMARALAIASAPAASATTTVLAGLTNRELDVLRLIVDGSSNRKIADALSLSERTVENHVLHILNKLGLDSRTAAAMYAVRNGLV